MLHKRNSKNLVRISRSVSRPTSLSHFLYPAVSSAKCLNFYWFNLVPCTIVKKQFEPDYRNNSNAAHHKFKAFPIEKCYRT